MIARKTIFIAYPRKSLKIELALDSSKCLESLLKESQDVFQEPPKGLPPLRGIEHQIDFIPGASLPNRLAYKTNSDKTKEINKQVEELLDKGWDQDNMSSCVMLVILSLKRMVVGEYVHIVASLITSPSSIGTPSLN